ncbi:C-C motif chemokine 20-like isoform X2 [Eleutherodactylus coqui]|uniref:C-C motif chemokine 20-like isoform X2 n=1 Tax=Eleutherodactylus coqui TaxID=57060 RepID=UPI003461F389
MSFGIFDCCRRHTDKKFKVSQVGMFVDYYHQDSSGVCDIDAIVFTVISRPCNKPQRIDLCADPEQNWVKNMISAMKKQTKKSKKRQERKRQKQCKRTKKI